MQSRALVRQIQSLLDERRPRTQGRRGTAAEGVTVVGRGPKIGSSLTDENINEFDDMAFYFDTGLRSYQPYLHRKYKNNKPKVIANLYKHHPARDINDMLKKGPSEDDGSAMFAAATMKRQTDKYFRTRKGLEWEKGGKKYKLEEYRPSIDFAYDTLDHFDARSHKVDKETIANIHSEIADQAKELTRDGRAPTAQELGDSLKDNNTLKPLLDNVILDAEVGGMETARA